MALRSLVKISSVNNLSDARYTAGMGVELMGFNLDTESEQRVSPEEFHAITSWISGVKLVGEVDSITQHQLAELMKEYPVDYIQVVGSKSIEIEKSPLPVIVKIDRPDQEHITRIFNQFGQLPAWYLLEPSEPFMDDQLTWCMEQASFYPIILGSNIKLENLDQLLDAGFGGISLRGGNEIRPGYKDFDELADILEALEEE